MRRGPYFSYRPGAFSERFFGPDAMSTLRREMNRVFDELELPRRGGAAATTTEASTTATNLSVDVTETADAVKVCADLPGVNEADIDVTLDEDVLTIRAERRSESQSERGRVHVSERSAASVQRSVRLPSPVDPDAVQADFRNGVLTVTLPKPKSGKGRKIPIGGASSTGPAASVAAASSDAAPAPEFIQGDGALGATPSTGAGAEPATDVENAAKPGGAVHGYNE